MRSEPCNHGRCPIADDAPTLDEENRLTVSIFQKAYQAGDKAEGEKKTYRYIRPVDVVALMDSFGIDRKYREEMYQDLIMLQETKNRLLPNRG